MATSDPFIEPIVDGRVVPIKICKWREFAKLPIFDMRNGDPADCHSLLIKATVSEAFHWVPVEMAKPEDALLAIDAFIMSHLCHLSRHRPADWNDALVRKAAIVLGTIRAMVTAYYRPTATEFISGECVAPYMAAEMTPGSVPRFTVRTSLAADPTLVTPLELSEREEAAVAALVKCSLGIPPMQGYSLIMTGHHYLSEGNNQSRKCFDVVERAYWAGTGLTDWFKEDHKQMQDLAWHKSCHPLQITFKERLAMDDTMPKRLKAVGSGACASRLPAVEPELRAANSYVTCISTVAALVESVGSAIDFEILKNAELAARAYLPENEGVATGMAIPDKLPPEVKDRNSALAWLTEVLRRSQDVAAFCYGFYCALCDQNSVISATADGQSLKASNSLMKLRNQCFATFAMGQSHYTDYMAAKNAARAAGDYVTLKMKIK